MVGNYKVYVQAPSVNVAVVLSRPQRSQQFPPFGATYASAAGGWEAGTTEATRQKDSLHVNEKNNCTCFVFQGGGTHLPHHTFLDYNTDDRKSFLMNPSFSEEYVSQTCRGGPLMNIATSGRMKTARHTLATFINSFLRTRRRMKLRYSRYGGISHRLAGKAEGETGRWVDWHLREALKEEPHTIF